ncbi:ribonuclease E activity regulator RraA [Glaciecola petra]|uniref:4-hydroxy-4-methyl-2-oxoglutarate aldolase n=1 Tax=Glaciecola petra TaxID=3075602 RepID=A0ABU2ZW75_9ALTE|nr:ribonuclease E activity regulator RraA [Aestuariibacter sp. P117]MDT0595672.1 ribonuclease E activity regulator RraA [Aestuariibacter sp. P117]
MDINTSEICDMYADTVDVVDPIFTNFGGGFACCGEISTVKCFEDRGLIDKLLASDGVGKVLLIDGGGSLRRAIIDAENIQLAIDNGWEGVVCYGAVRDVDLLEEFDFPIYALGAIPVSAESREIGDLDIAVNFAGVTFLPEDHLYADSSGVVLSPEPLELD